MNKSRAIQESNLESMINGGFKADKRDSSSWTYQVELFLVTLKSLVPSLKEGGNRIDYIRFEKELNLWKNYRHGHNKALIEASNKTLLNYFENNDDSISLRVLAITAANESIDTIKEEVIKNILYFTGNSKEIIKGIFLSAFLYFYFKGNDIETAVSKAKEEIIQFSIRESILDSEILKKSLENENSYIVKFEKARIQFISKLNSEIKSELEVLSLIEKLDSEEERKSESSLNSFLSSYDNQCLDKDIDSFSLSISKYLWKLRKGWVSPEKLIIKEYIEPDIFSLKAGEEVFHSLLNKIKLVSIEKTKELEVRYVLTKTGTYRFFKRINGR